ncbi:AMP-binding protein [Streptomyces exfoliatus]|uniref:AMP-binding protein n=1 Tax=Streptomyces exfoliatus TaxID=1905 RepID=UPI003C2E3F4B
MSNLATTLVETAQRYPQRRAVQRHDRSLTFAELDEYSARAAGALLAHGVLPGDRVGLRLSYSPTFTVLYFGALRTGAIVMPLYPTARSLAARPRDDVCGPRLVFTSPDMTVAQEIRMSDTTFVPVGDDFLDQMTFWPQHTGVVDRADHDPAAVVRTGDTTRAAGETMLSHRTLRGAALTTRMLIGERAANDDRRNASFSSTSPAYGLTALILSGACLSACGRLAAVPHGGRQDTAALSLAPGLGCRR